MKSRLKYLAESLGQDPLVEGLDVYMVGGAVRDFLRGKPAGDRDWVVVGATPEAMTRRGFIAVGADFPVFLHPQTKEEYALARTERKSGRGYKGFTFYTGADVTLEQDLQRRDLTINAMACSPGGQLIDPLNGLADLQNKVLRHVARAFAEDPVRLLRLARFAARFSDFSIAPETLQLARQLVDDGEVDALVPERVWAELAKGLKTRSPARMLDVLQQTGALERVMPGLCFTDEVRRDLDCAVRQNLSLPGRFALLCRLSINPAQVGQHIRAPGESIDFARLLPLLLNCLLPAVGPLAQAPGPSSDGVVPAARLPSSHQAAGVCGVAPACANPDAQLDIIERLDGLRKPERFLDLLRAVACVLPVNVPVWQARLEAVRGIDAGAIARAQSGQVDKIKAALRQARLEALAPLGDKADPGQVSAAVSS